MEGNLSDLSGPLLFHIATFVPFHDAVALYDSSRRIRSAFDGLSDDRNYLWAFLYRRYAPVLVALPNCAIDPGARRTATIARHGYDNPLDVLLKQHHASMKDAPVEDDSEFNSAPVPVADRWAAGTGRREFHRFWYNCLLHTAGHLDTARVTNTVLDATCVKPTECEWFDTAHFPPKDASIGRLARLALRYAQLRDLRREHSRGDPRESIDSEALDTASEVSSDWRPWTSRRATPRRYPRRYSGVARRPRGSHESSDIDDDDEDDNDAASSVSSRASAGSSDCDRSRRGSLSRSSDAASAPDVAVDADDDHVCDDDEGSHQSSGSHATEGGSGSSDRWGSSSVSYFDDSDTDRRQRRALCFDTTAAERFSALVHSRGTDALRRIHSRHTSFPPALLPLLHDLLPRTAAQHQQWRDLAWCACSRHRRRNRDEYSKFATIAFGLSLVCMPDIAAAPRPLRALCEAWAVPALGSAWGSLIAGFGAAAVTVLPSIAVVTASAASEAALASERTVRAVSDRWCIPRSLSGVLPPHPLWLRLSARLPVVFGLAPLLLACLSRAINFFPSAKIVPVSLVALLLQTFSYQTVPNRVLISGAVGTVLWIAEAALPYIAATAFALSAGVEHAVLLGASAAVLGRSRGVEATEHASLSGAFSTALDVASTREEQRPSLYATDAYIGAGTVIVAGVFLYLPRLRRSLSVAASARDDVECDEVSRPPLQSAMSLVSSAATVGGTAAVFLSSHSLLGTTAAFASLTAVQILAFRGVAALRKLRGL